MRRALTSLFVLLACWYALLTDGHFFSTDEIIVYETTRSLYQDGDLSIRPAYNTRAGVGGEHYGNKGIGAVIFSLPLNYLGSVLHTTLMPDIQKPFAGQKLGRTGRFGGDINIFVANLFNIPVVALLACVFFRIAVAFGFSLRTSIALAIILGFSTIVTVYSQTLFNHSLGTLFLLLTTYFLYVSASQARYGSAIAAGIFLGLAVLTRIELVIAFPLFLIYTLKREEEPLRELLLAPAGFSLPNGRALAERIVIRAVCFSLPVISGLMIYLCVNKLTFGSFFVFGLETHGTLKGIGTILEGIFGQLFSIGRSIFVYSPPLLLAVFYFRGFVERSVWEAALFFGLATLFVCFYSTFGEWHGGWCWGNRYLIPLVPFLLLPLGIGLEDAFANRKKHVLWLVALIALLGAGLQVLGAAPYITYIYLKWLGPGFSDSGPFLWLPQQSAIAEHWRAVSRGELDFWLYRVYQVHGLGLGLALAALPTMGLLASAAFTLKLFWSQPQSDPRTVVEP